MILTKDEISDQDIVTGGKTIGQRPTTYDATVGHIICEGKEITEGVFVLPPRGIVWVISNEVFAIPLTATGLATLKTTWTHNGILALNVGIVDPGWKGPLATAIVNFSKNSFTISLGMPFLRVIFLTHIATTASLVIKTKETYKTEITGKTNQFSDTFLTFDELVPEVAREIFKLPSWAIYIGIAALFVSFVAIYAPIAFSVGSDNFRAEHRVELLEKRVDAVCRTSPKLLIECEKAN